MFLIAESTGTTISKNRIKIYFELCKDLELQQLKENVFSLLKERVYSGFPQIAEIRGASKNEVENKAELAWIAFVNAIRNYGYDYSVMFKDPVIHTIVEIWGGWVRISEQLPGEEQEQQWWHKDFIKLYRGAAQKGEHSKYIKGFVEIQNGSKYPGFSRLIILDEKGKKIKETKPERIRALKYDEVFAMIENKRKEIQ